MKALRLLTLWLLLLSACAPAGTAVVSPAATRSFAQLPVSGPSIKNSPTAPAEATPSPASAGSAALAFPIRAAFYYPWFPQAWNQSGMDPFTHYHPTLGFYTQDDRAVIEKQIAAMQYGKIQLGIASWWGQGHFTDGRVPALLTAGQAVGFDWVLYIESEGQGNPSPEAIRADLTYIRDRYAVSPAYLKIDGHFVVFVYNDPQDGCEMAERWKQANTVGAYVVLKVFPGYRKCSTQPDGWHQYAPANAESQQGTGSFTISPGFWLATDAQPRLSRDRQRWLADIKAMIASRANFQFITTFNEWGEGTSVEDAREWDSPSGYGFYLDALHYDGNLPPSLAPNTLFLPTVTR